MGEMSSPSTAPAERLHAIGEASRRLGVHPRTLMAYERIGLVEPARRSNRRVYSAGELRWLGCVKELNREGGISLRGLATLLRFVPCWAIRSEVEAGESAGCSPAAHPAGQCLERVHQAYRSGAPRYCRTCGIYRSNRGKAREALSTGTATSPNS